jgi:fatty acid desaturase
VDIVSFARGHAVAVRILVNLIYIALLIWTTARGHWPYGLIVLPFLAYGTWRLWVLLRRVDMRAQSHDTSPQHPDGSNG